MDRSGVISFRFVLLVFFFLPSDGTGLGGFVDRIRLGITSLERWELHG